MKQMLYIGVLATRSRCPALKISHPSNGGRASPHRFPRPTERSFSVLRLFLRARAVGTSPLELFDCSGTDSRGAD
jgi:hypothetical protein